MTSPPRVERTQLAGREVSTTRGQLGWDHVMWMRSLLAEEDGDATTAISTLAEVWDTFGAFDIPSGRQWIGPRLARLALLDGDRDRAEAVARGLDEGAARTGLLSFRVDAERGVGPGRGRSRTGAQSRGAGEDDRAQASARRRAARCCERAARLRGIVGCRRCRARGVVALHGDGRGRVGDAGRGDHEREGGRAPRPSARAGLGSAGSRSRRANVTCSTC